MGLFCRLSEYQVYTRYLFGGEGAGGIHLSAMGEFSLFIILFLREKIEEGNSPLHSVPTAATKEIMVPGN